MSAREQFSEDIFDAQYPEGFWMEGYSSPPEATSEKMADTLIAKGYRKLPEVEALAQRLYETSPEAGEQGISWEKWAEMEQGSGHTFVRDSYRKQAEKILTFLQGEP